MSFLFNWLWGAGPDPREQARNSIVALREQLLVLDKREEHLQRKIDEELAKAKANVSTNKSCTLYFVHMPCRALRAYI